LPYVAQEGEYFARALKGQIFVGRDRSISGSLPSSSSSQPVLANGDRVLRSAFDGG
jgi:hypothetical protein